MRCSMQQRLFFLVALVALGLSGCAGGAPTRAGDPGHWAITKYLVRVYKVGQETAFEASKKYVLDNGYKIETEEKVAAKTKIHGLKASTDGLGKPRSIIIQTRKRGEELVQVEMKIGPAYSQSETSSMLDEYQKLLPEAAQPR